MAQGLGKRRTRDESRQQWLHAKRTPGDTPPGSADIQSLADSAGGYEAVDEMRVLPFDQEVLLRLASLIALPLLPLILMVIPLNEILLRIIEIILQAVRCATAHNSN